MKIVLVEDGVDHARILNAILKKEGYDVVWFATGIDAYKYLSENAMPDLLITDVMMPGMSGFELLERLKDDNKIPPCFVLTSKQREEDILRGLQFGVLDYITKPFSPSVLIAKVRNLNVRKAG